MTAARGPDPAAPAASPTALAAAERALGQVDLMLGNARVRALWWPYALADEAAGLAWSEGLVTSRTRVRLLAAQAARGPFGPGDQRGYQLYRMLQGLYRRGKPGPKALATALGGDPVTVLDDGTVAQPQPGPEPDVRAVLAGTLWALRRQRAGLPATLLAARALARLHESTEPRLHGSTAAALGLTRALAERGAWAHTPPLLLGWEAGSVLPGAGGRGGGDLGERVCTAIGRACQRHLRLVETLVHRRRALLDAAAPGRRDSRLQLAAEALAQEEVLTAGMLQAFCRRCRDPVAPRTARKLLGELVARGLAVEATGRRHFRVYTFADNHGNGLAGPEPPAPPRTPAGSRAAPPLARLAAATRAPWRAETSRVDLQQLFDDLETADARVADLLARLRG